MVKKQFIVYGLWFMVQLSSVFAFAQDVTFRATVDKDRITLDDQVELTLTVTGSQDVGEPELPELDEFSVASSGSSSQFSFINGKMSVSKSFTYILMPLKEGRLTIPSATIEIGGKILKTEPVDIEVIKSAQAPPSAPTAKPLPVTPQAPPTTPTGLKERLFIEVSTDKQTAYPGEQIIMTFKLYHRDVMIDNLQYTPPVTKGFITESMGPQREYRDIKNGIVYNVVELKTAIFPVTEGELIVEPARLKCNLLVREPRQRGKRGDYFDDFFSDFFEDPFFTNYVRYPIELESGCVKITINPFPAENKPDSFKGAIGTYDLTVTASPQSLKAGEPINLVMKISGAGNITQVPEPIIKGLTGFKDYESEVRLDITGRDPQIAGEKIFQKVIIPQDENVKEIPIIEFSYFDPILKQYCTITKGPIPISVAPGPKKEPEIVEFIKEISLEEEAKKQVRLLAKDIQFIKTSTGKYTQVGRYWYKNLWLWIIIIVMPVMGFGFSFVYKKHKTKMQQDIAYSKARGAHRISKQFLDEAIRYEKQNKPKEFYDSVAKAIQKFISDKLNIPPGFVTTGNLENLLTPKGIKEDILKSTKNLLDTCDLVRFGAHTATQSEMKQIIKDTGRIIGILNKRL